MPVFRCLLVTGYCSLKRNPKYLVVQCTLMGKLVAPLTLHFPRICWVAAPNIIMTLKVSRIAMLSAAKTGPKRNGTSRSRPKAECIYLGKGLDWVRMDQVWVGGCMCTYIYIYCISYTLFCYVCVVSLHAVAQHL